MAQEYSRKMKRTKPYPSSFVCPLTHTLLQDPVSDLCGHTFERQAIEAWLNRGHVCCPISRKHLSLADIKRNDELAERIERWHWEKEHEEEMEMLKTLSDEHSAGSRSNDDDDEEDTDDIELARPPRNYQNMQSPNYHPPTMSNNNTTPAMLLPQEQRALDVMRARHALRLERIKRRKCCYCSLALILVAVFTVALGLYWISTRSE